MSKRILSLVLALVMVLGTFGTVFAADPTDNAKVDWLVERNLVKGDEGGLRLKDQITRAEVATMLVRALDLEAVAEASKNFPSAFSDMNSPDVVWSRGHVTVAAAEGLVKGYEDGTFGPRRDITYAEVATMLVRVLGGLTEAEEKLAVGMNWSTIYLTKAAQLGIFEGVSVADYSAKAERETMFEMVYNAIVNKQFGNYTIVKGIVLENNRVESLGKDEVVVEVIKEIQTADYAKESRKEKGDQVKFVVTDKVGDVENLLGKVADFTLDKDGKVIKVTVDTTYNYVQGAVTATKNKVEVDGKAYTVELDERYREKDERIFRTYHNDKALSYEEFYQDPTTAKDRRRAEEFDVDFAKVTVKNGKVLYIDAFSFDDVAPVQEVKKDGAEVYIYNDQRDARVEKYAPATVIGFTEKDGFARIAKEDIEALDVIHVYTSGRNTNVIVRQDAKVDGKYEKVSEGTRGNFFVHVDGEKYYMNDVDYRRPVYSYDSKEFMTLYAKEAERDLREFRNENVTLLVDLNSDLQYIGAEIKFHEGIAVIDNILSRGDVRFIQSDNEKLVLSETFKSKLTLEGSTKNQQMSAFNRGDLVFVSNDEEDIDAMNRLVTANDINTKSVKVETTAKDEFVMNKDFIKLVGLDRYNIVNKTNVFIVNFNEKGAVTSIEGTTMADAVKNAKAKTELKAYVLSDKEFDKMDIGNRSRTSGRADVAHTVIFTNYKGADAKLDYETIELRYRFVAGKDREIEGKDVDGTTVYRKVDKDAKILDVNEKEVSANVGDILELAITKDDDKIVKEIVVRIPYNAPTFKITDIDSRSNYRAIELTDANGVRKEMWLSRDVEEFGKIALNDAVAFDTNKNGDIDVIKTFGRKAPTGTWDGSAVEDVYAKLEAVFKSSGDLYVRLDNSKVDFRYVGLQKEELLLAMVGENVIVTEIELGRNETAIQFIKLAPANKVNLAKAIVLAETKVEANYTAATWTTFKSALDAAKLVNNKVDATQAEVNVALANLNTAMAALVENAVVDAEKAAEVDVLILKTSNTIAGVTIAADKPLAEAARAAYELLTDAQKALVKNYGHLERVEARLVELAQ